MIKNLPHFKLKKFITFFFAYMIFEGMLRKWILPNFQFYIYFLKDFLLMFIYFYAIKNNLLFYNNYSKIFIFFIILISLFGLIGYDFNFQGLISYLLGIRSYWLYAPLALIAIKIFDADDLKKFFEINLLFVFPYFILILIQSYSDDTSVINSGFNSLVNNPERPSGYFTYTTQNTFYLGFLVSCLFSIISNTLILTVKKLIYYLVLIFILISISILLKSRAVYFFVFATFIYSFLYVIIFTEKNILKYKKLIIIGIFTPLLFLTSKNIFKKDYDFSAKRFNTDTYNELSIVKKYKGKKIKLFGRNIDIYQFCKQHSTLCRVVNELYFFSSFSDVSKYGKGIGSGTSVISAYKKIPGFVLVEEENHRIIHELGYLVGTCFVMLKFILLLLFYILSLYRDNKFYVISFLPIISIMMLIGPITYSVSYINFIFWTCLSIMVVCFKSKKYN